CEDTKYGQDCLKNCSINCTHQICHHDNGSCISCDPGYHGDLCTEECSNKTYGHNCAKTCSATCKTKSSVTCHLVTGQCLTECEDGYSGQFCENQ
ncbi:multiple epidermal growth factor-like domains protein 6 isoform X3, partial [Biomphalaria pfeifferi]